MTQEQKDNIKKWTAALRSGNYAQTTEVLRDNQGYCCLGIACEVMGIQTVQETATFFDYKFPAPDRDGFVILSCDVPDHWFEETFGFVKRSTLIIMNDSAKPFSEIADFIEEHYLES
jgi:hypothetical protein